MTDAPWQGDACSLVDAFRRGDHSPVDLGLIWEAEHPWPLTAPGAPV
jgi:hypothetical protein